MADPTPRSFRFTAEELMILWWLAREERRSQRGVISYWLYREMRAKGGDPAEIARQYRAAHPPDKAAQE